LCLRRSEWAAHLNADTRSVIETARRRAIGVLDAIRATLNGSPLDGAASLLRLQAGGGALTVVGAAEYAEKFEETIARPIIEASATATPSLSVGARICHDRAEAVTTSRRLPRLLYLSCIFQNGSVGTAFAPAGGQVLSRAEGLPFF
jgi:hypothetical protein